MSFAFALVFFARATCKVSSRELPKLIATTQTALHPSALADDSIAYRKIQEIELGHRIIGENPLRDEVDHSLPEPDALTWRALTLVMTKADGKRLDVGLLRPLEWIEDHGARPGGTIQLDLEELGASGPATVLSIAPCPPIELGPGQVVIGTFAHESSHEVLDISIAGEANPIGVTSNHPFWSVDRNEFVPAGDLRIGETLDTLTGQSRVTAVSTRGPPEPVYNLEVHSEHVYRVAGSGILVHNSYPTGFHGTTAENILSIISDGGLRPKNGKVFLSRINDTFIHGGDDITGHAYSLELEYVVGSAKVSHQSVFGNPQTVEISTDSLVPITIRRLHVRIPDGAGSFTPKTIEGVDKIVRFLTQ